jgi:hypothetical protein
MNIRDIEQLLMDGKLNVRFHNGVGMMQAYLTDNVRLHVWHPELTVPLESFGNRHDHRFDLESHILLGAIVDTKFRHIRGIGPFNVYTVKPAHFGDTPKPMRMMTNVAFLPIRICKFVQGEKYNVCRGVVHETRAEGLTVTLMHKSNQTEEWADIIATTHQEPEHAMLRKPPQELLDQLFFSALRKLPIEANETIRKVIATDV